MSHVQKDPEKGLKSGPGFRQHGSSQIHKPLVRFSFGFAMPMIIGAQLMLSCSWMECLLDGIPACSVLSSGWLNIFSFASLLPLEMPIQRRLIHLLTVAISVLRSARWSHTSLAISLRFLRRWFFNNHPSVPPHSPHLFAFFVQDMRH